MPLSRQHGFSLVELSIVLVILGLLVGGVLGGQSLIKAAELRAITSEYQQWQTALNVFKSRFFTIPGDMNNATAFWPGQTDNGDGNQVLNHPLQDTRERFLFWQHLALAGVISGEYTGVQGPSNEIHHVPGTNCPASKFSGGSWAAEHAHGNVIDEVPVPLFNMDYFNTLYIGGTTDSSDPKYEPLLTPEQAWNIDMKVDDGRPARGKFISPLWTSDCTTAGNRNDFDADYALSNSAAACTAAFRDSF